MAELLIEDRGAVRTLTMNRPDKRNALNNTLTEALLEGLRAADADDAVNVIVLTGAGTSFCAGADLSEFKTLVADNQPLVARRAQLTMSLHEIFPRLTKPVVSAINGAAIGGGAGLALAADIALMAESAQLAYPEVKHGIVAAIVMPNLVRQIGRKAAFELVATGRTIGARRALELGMVNRVLPDADLMSEALRLAEELAAVSRPAMATTKQLFYQVTELPFADALATGREANQRMRAFRK
jgi:enoyl-CoA hydratase